MKMRRNSDSGSKSVHESIEVELTPSMVNDSNTAPSYATPTHNTFRYHNRYRQPLEAIAVFSYNQQQSRQTTDETALSKVAPQSAQGLTKSTHQFKAITPPINNEDGSDCWFALSPYAIAKRLYHVAAGKGRLKRRDIDEVLPAYFLDLQAKWWCGKGRTGFFVGISCLNLFIDRLICRSFYLVSSEQTLPERVYKRLLLCCNASSTKKAMFNTADDDEIANIVVDNGICSRQYDNAPEIIKSLAQGIYQGIENPMEGIFIRGEGLKVPHITAVINSELLKMCEEALWTIYRGVKAGAVQFTASELRRIKCLLVSDVDQHRRLAIRIIIRCVNKIEDISQLLSLQWKYLQSLSHPIDNEDVGEALVFIYQHLHDEQRAEELWCENSFEILLQLLGVNDLSIPVKFLCCDVLQVSLATQTIETPRYTYVQTIANYINEEAESRIKCRLLHIISEMCYKDIKGDEKAVLGALGSVWRLFAVIKQSQVNADLQCVVTTLYNIFFASTIRTEPIIDPNELVALLVNYKAIDAESELMNKMVVSILVKAAEYQLISCQINDETLNIIFECLKASRGELRYLVILYWCAKHDYLSDVGDSTLLSLGGLWRILCWESRLYLSISYALLFKKIVQKNSLAGKNDIHFSFLAASMSLECDLSCDSSTLLKELHVTTIEALQKEFEKDKILSHHMQSLFSLQCSSIIVEHIPSLLHSWLQLLTAYSKEQNCWVLESVMRSLEQLLRVSEEEEEVLKVLLAFAAKGIVISRETFLYLLSTFYESNDSSLCQDICEVFSALKDILPKSCREALELEDASQKFLMFQEEKDWNTLVNLVRQGTRLSTKAWSAVLTKTSNSSLQLLTEYGSSSQHLLPPLFYKWLEEKCVTLHPLSPGKELNNLLLALHLNNKLPSSLQSIVSVHVQPSAAVTFVEVLWGSLPDAEFLTETGKRLNGMSADDAELCFNRLHSILCRNIGLRFKALQILANMVKKGFTPPDNLKKLVGVLANASSDPVQLDLTKTFSHPNSVIDESCVTNVVKQRIMVADGDYSALVESTEPYRQLLMELKGCEIDMSIVYTIHTNRYPDLPCHLPVTSWTKWIIISSFLSKHFPRCLSTSHMEYQQEEFELLQCWNRCAKLFNRPDTILQLLQLLPVLNYEELLSCTKYLPLLNESNIIKVLAGRDASFTTLRTEWLGQLLQNEVNERNRDDFYLSDIAERSLLHAAEKVLMKFAKTSDTALIFYVLGIVTTYKVSSDEIDSIEANALLTFLSELELIQLMKLDITSSCNVTKVKSCFRVLLEDGWHFETLCRALSKAMSHPAGNTRSAKDALCDIVCLLSDYSIRPSRLREITMILSESSEWLMKVNELVVQDTFIIAAPIKSYEQMVEECSMCNKDIPTVKEFAKTFAQKDMTKLQEYMKVTHGWTYDDIADWLKEAHATGNYFAHQSNALFALAVISKANALLTGFQVTSTQLLTCLLLLRSPRRIKMLFQIETGQGKTIIIAILAILLVLKGRTVDIITSSPVEAERCCREQKKLYSIFDMQAAHNIDIDRYISGTKSCYHKHVVYGDISQFQFDFLRQEYGKLGTRGNRAYDIVLGDEIDSILIDDSTKIAKLSQPVGGLDELMSLYFYLAKHMEFLQGHIAVINQFFYIFYGRITYDDDKVGLSYETNGQSHRIADLSEYLLNHELPLSLGEKICDDITSYLVEKMTDYLEELLKRDIVLIPTFLQDFVARQKATWVRNVVHAYTVMQPNAHYLIIDNQIKPVAFESNGTIQNSTQWSGGLHQFLQIKHQLPVHSESITTNFISNCAFVKKYKGLCGLTGTLGPPTARRHLEKTYGVCCVEIPSIRTKQYKELAMVLTHNRSDWIKEIIYESLREIRKKRGVLIICQLIEEVQAIENHLKECISAAQIKTYTMNGVGQEREVERIGCRQVIVATTLGGRGVDIKADDVNQYGGMHVILTFLSEQRNCDQAMFRTSRQGRLGTGRMILCKPTLLESFYKESDMGHLMETRDMYESFKLDNLFNKELSKVQIKDELFAKFCLFLSEVKQYGAGSSTATYLANSILALFQSSSAFLYERMCIAAAEEQWSVFLQKLEQNHCEKITAKSVRESFETMLDELRKKLHSSSLITNPIHLVVLGYDLLARKWGVSNLRGTAIAEAGRLFKEAIKISDSKLASAHVGLGWYYIVLDDQDKEQAKNCFCVARNLVLDELSSLMTLQSELQRAGKDLKSPMMQQLVRKVNMLGCYSKCIDELITDITRSQRLFDLRAEPVDKTMGQVKYLCELQVEDALEVLKNDTYVETKYTLYLNDLTVYADIATKDQAISTLNNVEKLSSMKGVFMHVRLEDCDIEGLTRYLIRPYFLQRLTIEEALKVLNDRERTWTNILLPEVIIKASVFNTVTKKICTTQDFTSAIKRLLSEYNADQYEVNLTYSKDSLPKTCHIRYANFNIDDIKAFATSSINSAFRGNKLSIEIDGTCASLISLLRRLDIQCATLSQQNQNQITKTIFPIAELLSLLIQKPSDSIAVVEIIPNTSINNWADLLVQEGNLRIHVLLITLDFASLASYLPPGRVQLDFKGLSFQQTKEVILVLRSRNIGFSLGFGNLFGKSVVEDVINHADRAEERLLINFSDSLKLMFGSDDKDAMIIEQELQDLKARGVDLLPKISEKGFVPWNSVVGMTLIATAQITAGYLLTTTGAGAQTGMALITEGAVDLSTAYRAYSTRQFSWKDYALQKTVSLVLSSANVGWQSLKDAKKGTVSLISGVQNELLEQAGKQLVVEGKAVGVAFQQSYQQLRGAARGYVGFTLAETGAREVLNSVVDSAAQFCFASYRHEITDCLRGKVRDTFAGHRVKLIFSKLLTLDKLRNNNYMYSKLKEIIWQVYNPSKSFWQENIDKVALPLFRGILSTPQLLGSRFTTALMIRQALTGSREMIQIVENFDQALVRESKLLNSCVASPEQLLQAECGLSFEETTEVISILEEHEAIDSESLLVKIDMLQGLDIAEGKANRIKTFYHRYNQEIAKEIQHDLGDYALSVLADQLIRIFDMKLRSPLSSHLVGWMVKKTSEGAQNFVIRSQMANDLSQRSAKDSCQADKRETQHLTKALESNATFTYSNQVIKYAAEVNKQKSQCEIIHYATNGKKSTKAMSNLDNDQLKKYAEGVAEDSPAHLGEMFTMASENGLKIKVVDISYQPTAQELEADAILIVYTPGDADREGKIGVGHWSLWNANGGLIDIEMGGENDCGYAVMAKLTGKSIQQLRQETASSVLQNNESFSAIVETQLWITERYSKEAHTILMAGATGQKQAMSALALPNSGGRDYTVVNDSFNASKAVYDVSVTEIGELELIAHTDVNCKPKSLGNSLVKGACALFGAELQDKVSAVGVYRNNRTGQVYIAFQGTDGVLSWLDNTDIAVGEKPDSYSNAKQIFMDLKSTVQQLYPGCEIILTGHSKGAALASYFATDTGGLAIVYDNPGCDRSKAKDHVISVQSTPNPVNCTLHKKGNEVNLKAKGTFFFLDNALGKLPVLGTLYAYGRNAFSVMVGADHSHSLASIEDLLEENYHDKNKSIVDMYQELTLKQKNMHSRSNGKKVSSPAPSSTSLALAS